MHISAGLRQRLAIARTLLAGNPLVFLDEPTVKLDPRGAQRIRSFVAELRLVYGVSVVLTTHDMFEADELCDRIAILEQRHWLRQLSGLPPDRTGSSPPHPEYVHPADARSPPADLLLMPGCHPQPNGSDFLAGCREFGPSDSGWKCRWTRLRQPNPAWLGRAASFRSTVAKLDCGESKGRGQHLHSPTATTSERTQAGVRA